SGSDALVRWLERSLEPELAEVRLDTVALTVRWTRRGVAVHCENRAGRALPAFTARTAVVTVPAAVLAAGAIRFEPKLPEKEAAARRLEPGHVFKMVLRFKTAFWEEDGFLARRLARARPEPPPLNFVHDLEQPIGTW